MARDVHLQPGAYDDIRAVVAFIARRVSPAAAARWHARIHAAIRRLETEA
ncbi:hypothetical protein [Gemmata sp.]